MTEDDPWLGKWSGYPLIAKYDREYNQGTVSMLSPGSSGYALLVAVAHDDCNYGASYFTQNGLMFFSPAVVKYKSPLDVSGYVASDVRLWCSEYDMPGPILVAEMSGEYNEKRIYSTRDKWWFGGSDPLGQASPWGCNSVADGYSYHEIDCVFVNAMSVIPITEEAAIEIGQSISKYNDKYPISALYYSEELLWSVGSEMEEFDYLALCHCRVVEAETVHTSTCRRSECGEGEHTHTRTSTEHGPACQFDGNTCPCDYILSEDTCTCGSKLRIAMYDKQFIEHQVESGGINAYNCIPEKYHALWEHAVNRYVTGQQALLKFQEENECNTLSWRSPWQARDMLSLEQHRPQQSSGSISSSKQLEFFPAS